MMESINLHPWRQREIGNMLADCAALAGVPYIQFDEIRIEVCFKGQPLHKMCFSDIGVHRIKRGDCAHVEFTLVSSDHNSHGCPES